MVDSTNLTNDRFGYSCYALVFPASPEVTAKVAVIETASKMTRAKIPAHITVKGTFHRIASLDRVRELARSVINVERFWISFEGASVYYTPTGNAGLDVRIKPEMRRLHDDLVAAFRPISTTIYPDDPYQAHLTLCQDPPKEGIEAAQRLIAHTDLGSGFEATAVDLWGRSGPAYGGHWELIEQFSLR